MLRSSNKRAFLVLFNNRTTLSLNPNRSFVKNSSKEEAVAEDELFIPKSESIRFMRECMEKVGCPSAAATRLALNLAEADHRGHFSHGLNRLSMYVQDVKSGLCNPTATPTVLKETAATAWVDGNYGLGVVVGEFSMKLAISKAKSAGIGWVSAKGSNHFGICQWYTEMALKEGMVGMAATNTSPLVTPTRAKEAVFGTNPISFAAPGKKDDRFLLDMSTSSVAVGKIEMQLRKRQSLPSSSWALDRSGKPTTDAKEAFFDGTLTPLGGQELNSGYKGYGMAMAVELLCGLMSGSLYGPKVRKWTSSDTRADLGQCFIAVNPECFAPGMSDRLQDLMDFLRKLEPADPEKPVLVPGDPERLCVAAADAVGAIKYTEDHIVSYRKLATELGVSPMQKLKK